MRRRYLTGIFSLLLAFSPRPLVSSQKVSAQVIPDATLDNESTQLQRQGNRTLIEGGASRGAALFHSFEQFSIAEDQQVFFANPQNIDAILSRITGNTPSNLNGMLGVLGSADLYLLNPNGIIFGPNAQLDLSGSFTASTADSLQAGDTNFSAISPESVPLLSISVLPGIQFGANASDRLIQNQATLTLAPQQQLSFDGGTVEQAGQITIPGGTVDLRGRSLTLTGAINTRGANNQPGRLRLSSPDDLNIDVTAPLTNSAISQALQNNEVVVESDLNLTLTGPVSSTSQTPLTLISGENLALLDDGTGESFTLSANVALQSGGDILVTLPIQSAVTHGTPQFTIQAVGEIAIRSEGTSLGPNLGLIEFSGDGGVLSIEADNLTISESGNVFAIAEGIGATGPDVEVLVSRDVVLGRDVVLEGGAIGTRATTGQTAGDIRIRAGESVQVLLGSNIGSFPSPGEIANTGSINIQAGDTILLRSGLVATQSTVAAGDIDLAATQIILDGSNGQSLIAADTQMTSTDDAGNITLNATDSIELIGDRPGPFIVGNIQQLGLAGVLDFGFGKTTIQASAFGGGASGRIEVNTDRLSIRDGALIVNATGLFGSTTEAGDVVINASDVQLRGLALISTGTIGSKDAGRLEINSDRIRLEDGASIGVSSIFGSGDAGTIEIRTDELIVTDGSAIAANSDDGGGGGFLDIEAQSITVSGTSADGSFPSGLLTDVSATSTGPGGPLTIQTGTLEVLDGGQIRTSTQGAEDAGDLTIAADQVTVSGLSTSGIPSTIEAAANSSGEAGDIELSANRLTIEEQAVLSTQSLQGTGGDITLSVEELLLLREQGAISATAGVLDTEGDGGNITIEAGFVVAPALENSDITANAFLGTGGKVTISTNALLGIAFRDQTTVQSDITASSAAGLDGTVVIDQLVDNVELEVVQLPENLASTEDQLTAGCLLDEDASFVATGRGGIPADPGERLNQALIWNDSRVTVDEDRQLNSPSSRETVDSTTLTEAQGWRINEQGKVELVAVAERSSPLSRVDCPSK